MTRSIGRVHRTRWMSTLAASSFVVLLLALGVAASRGHVALPALTSTTRSPTRSAPPPDAPTTQRNSGQPIEAVVSVKPTLITPGTAATGTRAAARSRRRGPRTGSPRPGTG
jgi:hypothetical protein